MFNQETVICINKDWVPLLLPLWQSWFFCQSMSPLLQNMGLPQLLFMVHPSSILLCWVAANSKGVQFLWRLCSLPCLLHSLALNSLLLHLFCCPLIFPFFLTFHLYFISFFIPLFKPSPLILSFLRNSLIFCPFLQFWSFKKWVQVKYAIG